jgi:hypothetical protein
VGFSEAAAKAPASLMGLVELSLDAIARWNTRRFFLGHIALVARHQVEYVD